MMFMTEKESLGFPAGLLQKLALTDKRGASNWRCVELLDTATMPLYTLAYEKSNSIEM